MHVNLILAFCTDRYDSGGFRGGGGARGAPPPPYSWGIDFYSGFRKNGQGGVCSANRNPKKSRYILS